MVRPPPGVSSADSVPSIASARPRATASPRPDAVARRRVAEPLERQRRSGPRPRPGRPGRGRRRAAGCGRRAPLVDDPHPAGGGLVAQGVLDDVASTRSSRPGSATTTRAGPGRASSRPASALGQPRRRPPARPRRGRPAAVRRERPGLEPRHVEQVADERVEPVGGVLDRRLGARPRPRRRRSTSLERRLPNGRLDAGERGAQVVRRPRRAARCGPVVRGRARRPRRPPAAGARRCRIAPACAANAASSRWSVGGDRRADEDEVVLVVDAGVRLRPVAGCRRRRTARVVRLPRRRRRDLGHDLGGVAPSHAARRRRAARRTCRGRARAARSSGRWSRAGCGSARPGQRTPAGRRLPARPAGRWCARRTRRPQPRR